MSTHYNSLYVFRITLVATLGGLLFGYDTAVISGTVGSISKVFVEPQHLSETAANSLLGFCVASALIGCIIGGLMGGYLSNRFGRRNSLLIAAFLFFIAAIGSAWPELGFRSVESQEIPYYLAGYVPEFVFYRIVGGIGVGLASMLSPMYIAEVAPAEIRGKLVSFNQFAIIFGQLLVYCVNYAIASSGDQDWLNIVGWRYMFLSLAIPALLFFGLLFTVPESPRWLTAQNKISKAQNILSRILGSQRTEEALNSIISSLSSNSTKKSSPLLKYGIGVIVIGILLSAFQQLMGINVVLYYAPEVFKNLGASTDSALLQTIIVGVINLSFTTIAIFTVDKLGRKPLQIIGAIGMAIGMITLGTTFFLQLPAIIALTSMLFYIASFAISWGPVCWVLLSEIFPNSIRSKALSIAVAAQWITNYLVSWTFPIMDKNTYLVSHFNNGFAYWLYGVISVVAAIFIWKWLPETKGKSLEELEQFWNK
ncbi:MULTISPECIES: D-xylose transporter XylE [unclassified Gilliamella]|uniref:D-xylose transporter XylE n=1 Tax=unclassified Gilliamella TaxID=2685620 RepID=UPI00080E49F5|nr:MULTISPECIES: D-xylose transporter XylE [Gilliamella]MCX8582391.1 D-xylose transporter XylE [Gilliamella sp. B3482]MCX8582871.1 D-xylose transporter XylE [Gilliamella sp. B3372]MCX8586815.1 D-xylose transporter XylE [Gilliamella sp. B3562]MCX8595584.1 D-xylose transporter XylE [Gilliamella sp. B3367]MCX8662418.1 D-xylose transporter XylE [Gilliamella sp. B2911]